MKKQTKKQTKKHIKKKTGLKGFLTKIKKKIKNLVVRFLAFGLLALGYNTDEARDWVKQVYWSLRSRKYSFAQKVWAVRHGFLPEDVERLGVTKENFANMISRKEYAFLRPLNGIYSKWITDIVTAHAVFKPYRDKMATCYYQISERDGKCQIIPLYDRDAGDKMRDVIDLLREKKRLKLRSSSERRRTVTLSYYDKKFRINGKRAKEKDVRRVLKTYPGIGVIMEDLVAADAFAGGRLRVFVYNEQGDDPRIGDAFIRFRHVDRRHGQDPSDHQENEILTVYKSSGREKSSVLRFCVDKESGKLSPAADYGDTPLRNPSTGVEIPEKIPCWQEICDTVDSMCRFAPQLEFFALDIVITEDGFKISRIQNHPAYPQARTFSDELTAYFKRKAAQKRSAYPLGKIISNGCNKFKLFVRTIFARIFFPKGLYPYLSIRLIRDMWKDFRTNKDTTLKEKFWAIRHGYISYRLHQYGITPENHLNFISDFEYKWLRHINNKYRHWMEDKITVKYICSEYNSCFPEYYYYISLKNGNNKLLSMMDLPQGYTNTYSDIFRLVQEKGSLALKPDEGSHGNGFFRFSYENGKYYLNYNEATEQDVLDILQDVKNQYIITEYIDMHEELKRIYPGAVNTIRMIVFKKDGKTPVIGNAYMRFGSKRTGAVDNMGAGGMYARVDVETGRFYDSKIIEANEIKPCLYHPDTNVKIDGYLPNWEKVKADVLAVARSIPQLEYFGFDLALTPDGLKFPEINRFPDYPAIEKYTPQTIDYLLYKLRQKKKKFGYNKHRGHSVFKLPKR